MRIIGGQFRRTPLTVVDAPGLRPTPDRVRETVFNWLGHLWADGLEGRRVLDLFAGTGALGLEAASRGAAEVTLVETDARAVAALREVAQRLRAANVRVVARDANTYLGAYAGAHFDLVLLDPPFGQGWLERVWPRVEAVLAPDALVYVESETALVPPPGFQAVRQAKAGAVFYHLLQADPSETG